MDILKSQRGADILVLNGYQYRKHAKATNTSQRWRCRREGCNGKAQTKPNRPYSDPVEEGSHNHPPVPEKDLVDGMRDHMKAELRIG